MKKFLFFQRNKMNIFILLLVSCILLFELFTSLFSYGLSVNGIGLTGVAAFTSDAVVLDLVKSIFSALAIISLWVPINRFYLPAWCIGCFGVCAIVDLYANNLLSDMFWTVIFIIAFCVPSILYYLWCQKNRP